MNGLLVGWLVGSEWYGVAVVVEVVACSVFLVAGAVVSVVVIYVLCWWCTCM